jgi:ABC-type dipeptide/oligopeptide/nickel transport system permease subunit
MKKLKSNNLFSIQLMLGFSLVFLMVSSGIMAPMISPSPPHTQILEFRNKPPGFSGTVIYFRHKINLPIQSVAVQSFKKETEGVFYTDFLNRSFFLPNNKLEKEWVKTFTFLLGADQFGRDVLSRIIYGARISLLVGVCASTISILIGVLFGGVAGFFGSWTETILMRITDMMFGFPVLLFLISITVIFKPSLTVLFVAIGLVSWPGAARLVRGQVLSVKSQEYILAARTMGISSGRILWRHIFPNCLSPVIIIYALGVGSAVLAEAGLSFLGLGAQPPIPSWGSMINLGKDFIRVAPWISIAPGVAIALTVLGFNLVGDSLRDYFDPRMETKIN